MPKRIEVPGAGIVEFPDTMSDDDIVSAIKTQIIPNYANKAPTKAVEPEKSVSEKFMQPLKEMSVEDWKKNSLLYPALQFAGGLIPGAPGGEQMFQEGTAGLKQKGGQIFEGLKNIVQNPIEAGKAAYTAVTERPAETAGNLVKGLIYDPEQLLVGPAAGAVTKGTVATAKAGAQTAKGLTGTATGRIAKPGAVAEPWQIESARIPIDKTYITPEDLANWRASGHQGLPPEQPIGQLAAKPGVQQALNLTRGNIPVEGQAARAFGETLAENYKQRPLLNLASDVALAGTGYALGGPVGAAVGQGLKLGYQGIQAARQASAAKKLAQEGFSYLTPEERALLKNRIRMEQTPFGGYGGVNYNLNPTVKPGPVPGAAVPQAPAPQPVPTAMGAPVVPETAPAPTPVPTNYNVPAFQRQGAQIPGVNAPETPAQANATALGITPPMTAAESGFTQELNTLAKGAAVPETPAPVATIETPAPAVAVEAPAVVEPIKPQPETVKRIDYTPHENTQPIAQALQEKVSTNPALTGFDQPYVYPEAIRDQATNWIRHDFPKNMVAEGPAGTGKTALATEWLRKNPSGQIEYISPEFDKADASRIAGQNLTLDPKLLLVDEADLLKKGQIEMIKELTKTNPNIRVYATTNEPKKLDSFFKSADFGQMNLGASLTPEERSAFALNIAKDFNINKTPAEIEAIAQNPELKTFRDIKRTVSEGISKKEPPRSLFERPDVEVYRGKIADSTVDLFDSFLQNGTSKNVIIVDPSAYKKVPGVGKIIDSLGDSNISIDALPKVILSGGGVKDTYIVNIMDKTDATKLVNLKGIIERSNESSHPVKLIIEDKQGLLDPAFYSRAYTLTDKDFMPTSKAVMEQVSTPAAKPTAVKNAPAKKTFNVGTTDEIEANKAAARAKLAEADALRKKLMEAQKNK